MSATCALNKHFSFSPLLSLMSSLCHLIKKNVMPSHVFPPPLIVQNSEQKKSKGVQIDQSESGQKATSVKG